MDYTVGDIVDQCYNILLDEQVEWEYPEVIEWYNIGQQDIVSKKPDANLVIEAMELEAGSRQTIPTKGIFFVKVTMNLLISGNTTQFGSAVTLIKKEVLDVFNPNWTTSTNRSSTIIHYAVDEADPLAFWVYPGSRGGNSIELVYSKSPAQIAYDAPGVWKTYDVGIKEGYVDALINYILYRSFAKDTGTIGNIERSQVYLNAYYTSLGLQPLRQGGNE